MLLYGALRDTNAPIGIPVTIPSQLISACRTFQKLGQLDFQYPRLTRVNTCLVHDSPLFVLLCNYPYVPRECLQREADAMRLGFGRDSVLRYLVSSGGPRASADRNYCRRFDRPSRHPRQPGRRSFAPAAPRAFSSECGLSFDLSCRFSFRVDSRDPICLKVGRSGRDTRVMK